jgi:hypothetical protein
LLSPRVSGLKGLCHRLLHQIAESARLNIASLATVEARITTGSGVSIQMAMRTLKVGAQNNADIGGASDDIPRAWSMANTP